MGSMKRTRRLTGWGAVIPDLWPRFVLSTLVVVAYIVALAVLAWRESLTALSVLALALASVLLVGLIWRR